MAIDTAVKRYSMMGLASPVPRLLPIPDGTIAPADRIMLLYLYHGIAPVIVIPVTVAFTFYVPNPAASLYVPSPTANKEIPG